MTKPQFYIASNLMGYGGGPDLNRRFVHHWPSRGASDEEIAVFRASDPEAGWTARDNRAVAAYLAVLNEDRKSEDD